MQKEKDQEVQERVEFSKDYYVEGQITVLEYLEQLKNGN